MREKRVRMKNPPHPGKLIKSDLEALGLTITEAAEALDVTRTALSEIIHGKRGISAQMAWKLSKAFLNSEPEFWLRLQASYDLAQVGEDCANNVRTLWNPPSLEEEKNTTFPESKKSLALV